MATEVIWWVFAILITILSAGVVFSRSVIHSAIFLIGSLAGVGVMFVLMTVEFLALTQFLIYGGAVTVLVLLALMLTRADPSGRAEKVNGPQAPFALVAGIGVAAVLLVAGLSTEWAGNTDAPTNIAIETISQRLFEDYGLPFILASVLLLVALIGAIIVARQEEGE
ncbi:MAG: NADH-quinone oxidoreductase subunit J [Dehalococcoidia bacterium]|nr:NADH-quinone oxidoreductase subunit J [Dehalococcoidia bacterium]